MSLGPIDTNLVQQRYSGEDLPLREMMKHSEGPTAHARGHNVSPQQVPPSCQQQASGVGPESEAQALTTAPEGSQLLRC